MNPENIRMLELAAERLGELTEEVVFVGGTTTVSRNGSEKPASNTIRRAV